MSAHLRAELEIASRLHNYPVVAADSLGDALKCAVEGATAYALVDSKVHQLYGAHIDSVIPASRLRLIEASEEEKSFDRLAPTIGWLLESGFNRSSRLVVVGGGVVQDIGCFIASVLMRGITWSLVPTTLLAQCDSCIGSKSSINILHYKNQLGTFYPPHQVLLVFELLATLTRDEVRGGLGEMIKLHLIEGSEAFDRLRAMLTSPNPPLEVLPAAILDSLRIKQRFIEEDEFDAGVRRLLNYGHTFAHAFESATHYAIPHGIAVTLGVQSATFVSRSLDMIEETHFHDLRAWLIPFYQPFQELLQSIDPELILAAMKHDKKNQGDGITCILTRGPGRMERVGIPPATLQPLLIEALASL